MEICSVLLKWVGFLRSLLSFFPLEDIIAICFSRNCWTVEV
jgi:hypothetical protein